MKTILQRFSWSTMGLLPLLLGCSGPGFEGSTNIWESGANGKYGTIALDSSFNYSQVAISEKAVPAAVVAEAANPSIVNPYSGNQFGADRIGTFSPADTLEFGEWTLGIKYIFPRIPFFIGGELEVPLGEVRTDDGVLGDDYTYARLMDTAGIDFVRYFYGIHYEQWIVKPSFGFHLEFGEPDTRWFLQPTVKYDHISLTYVKGIEAFEDKHFRTTLGHTDLNVFDLSIKVGMIFKDSDDRKGGFYIYGGPMLTDKTGIDGWSIGLGGLFAF